MTPNELEQLLRETIREVIRVSTGHPDAGRVERITRNWFDETVNYDGRWALIRARLPAGARVLDMAAGCGTFLLHGLRLGADVWGVEPEPWKRDFFVRKIETSAYPAAFRQRFIAARGESLPFADARFDLVTSYQTIEHVQDLRACLQEMLRVLRPGGVLYIRAPDYSGFFEPHYGLPMWPRMNKRLAAACLRLLKRPQAALAGLHWVTTAGVLRLLQASGRVRHVARSAELLEPPRRRRPRWLRGARRRLRYLGRFWREEKQIDLWVTLS